MAVHEPRYVRLSQREWKWECYCGDESKVHPVRQTAELDYEENHRQRHVQEPDHTLTIVSGYEDEDTWECACGAVGWLGGYNDEDHMLNTHRIHSNTALLCFYRFSWQQEVCKKPINEQQQHIYARERMK